MTFEEKTIDSKRIYEGRIINLRKDRVTVLHGTSEREIVEHPGGAVIAALKDDRHMIMVRQYRKAAGRVVLEVAAGKIDPGEDPQDTALRELQEETGYRAGNIRFLTKMYPSVGYSEEVLYLYLCTDLIPGETHFDDNEAIDIEEYSLEELCRMVRTGRIEDGKSQVAVLMVRELLEEGELQECLK